MTRQWLTLACAVMSTACATTTTQLAKVDPGAVRAEEVEQREYVMTALQKQQQRLDDLAFPLLRAATPLCGDHVVPRYGLQFRSAAGLKGEWAAAARSALGLSDTVSVVGVVAGSPAEAAGVRLGDRVMAVRGTTVPPGQKGIETVSKVLGDTINQALSLTVLRDGRAVELSVDPVQACKYTSVVMVEGDINAMADGKVVYFPWAMMRFAEDDELRVVIAHEVAHNAMKHMDAMKKNALLGGLLGLVADVAMAGYGVNTGGQYTADFMKLGAMTFSQDFEREADYVGLYIMARAGVPLENAPTFWREFAQVNPAAISFASSHPTTAERFVRLRTTLEEIRAKQASGQELLPEMKSGRDK